MGRRKKRKHRTMSVKTGIVALLLFLLYCVSAVWFVQHPAEWIKEKTDSWPSFITEALFAVGNPIGDITDALSITGHDAVYKYDTPAPSMSPFFAGAPKRISGPAPDDIIVIRRKHFVIGWSPSLRHPVWCAYHVIPHAAFEAGERPKFQREKSINAPKPGEFANSGYDRGHMAPNYAIATRYGPDNQRLTFLMGNIAAQSPALNRGPWREIEHRIADLWTRRWGEIWVITGCYSEENHQEVLSGSKDIHVPERFYQILVAQDGFNVRALAVDFPQNISWRAWPSRYITSIDALEEKTGLDFLPDLPYFISSPLEAELPTRLWPVRFLDVVKMLMLHFN